jgi:hypothetical protein
MRRSAYYISVRSSERNPARQRSRAGSNSMAIVSTLDDPLAVLATDDLADVMAPDHDRADGQAPALRP